MASITNKPTPTIAICAFDLLKADGSIQIMPAGRFDAPYGAMEGEGPWVIDQAIAQRVIDRVASRANDMLIDYEHQSMLTSQNGKEAPAAGWAVRDQFEWREGDGLYLKNPKWTAKASQYIAGDEYRYLSPVFSYDSKTGEVLDIISIALTNNPALDDMGQVELKAAAKSLLINNSEGLQMATALGDKLRQLMKDKDVTADQLGSAAGIEAGTVNQILNGDIERPPNNRLRGFARVLKVSFESLVDELPADKKEGALSMNKKFFELLGLAEDASDEDIESALVKVTDNLAATTSDLETAKVNIAAAKAGDPDPAKYVPVAVVETLKTSLAALTVKVNDSEMDSLIEAGLSDGKILPAQEEWARSLDVAALTAYLDNASGVAALSGHQTKGKKLDENGNEELSKDELAVCKATGIKPEDYMKTKAALAS